MPGRRVEGRRLQHARQARPALHRVGARQDDQAHRRDGENGIALRARGLKPGHYRVVVTADRRGRQPLAAADAPAAGRAAAALEPRRWQERGGAGSGSRPPRRAGSRSPRRASPTRVARPSRTGCALRRVLDAASACSRSTRSTCSQRAHYLPLFSARSAPTTRAARPRGAGTRRAGCSSTGATRRRCSRSPLQPLLRWRMERAHDDAWGGMRRIQRERPGARRRGARRRCAERGPVAASEVLEDERPQRDGAVVGLVATPSARSSGCSGAGRSPRRGGAASSASTTCPSACSRAASSPRRRRAAEDAQRELVRIAARSLGVAAERDLRDYFRLPLAETRARVAELVEAGELLAGRGRGLEHAGLPATRRRSVPRRVDARALVGPFDSLIWERPRVGAAVRLPLPDRDLRAGAEARARLLRAAVPARATGSSRASTSRPTAPGGRAARAGRARRAGRAAARPRPRSPEELARWPAGWAWSASRSEHRGDLAAALRRHANHPRGSGRVSPAAFAF